MNNKEFKDYLGFDVGTGNLVSAKRTEENKACITTLRNMFVVISTDDISPSEMEGTKLNYIEVKDEEGEIKQFIIIGEDAFRFANIFNGVIRRPMQRGIISTKEIDAIDIMYKMIEKMIGGKSENGYCVYSVPAQAIDTEMPSIVYHEKVLQDRIFSKLGYTAKPLNEGVAVVYSECATENYSGIGISFGAGLTNVACVYKGIPAFTFSLGIGGDWIDKNAAESIGKLQTRVTRLKEEKLDLMNPDTGTKEEKRVKQALVYYYQELIRKVLSEFVRVFEEKSEGLEIDEEIPIVLSGGTSMATGFKDLFIKTFEEKRKEFPYQISEIRPAKRPLYAVALGCLSYALGKVEIVEDSL